MPPLIFKLLRRSFEPGKASSEFAEQWKNPGDVFSVLLILGGDIVGRAVAQLAGSRLTPVAFSFGWVAYAVTAVVSAVGENKLMPLPDCACKVINGDSTYVRDNTSWVLGRIMRDFEGWMHPDIRTKVEEILDQKREELQKDAEARGNGQAANIQRPKQAGLCVSFYKAEQASPGKTQFDMVYGSGFATAIFQLGVAAIPCGVWGDWSILLITAAGILLALLSGSLGQWKTEKWPCRPNREAKTVVLTRGNGAQHAIVIRDADIVGLDLESLAAGQSNVDVSTSLSTRVTVVLLAVLWILLLVSASGIKEHTWFLLAVGSIGTIQNIFVAGSRRDPSAFGIPLTYEKVIARTKVMHTLFAVEEAYPGLGFSMRETFFPGGQLKEHEVEKWEACQQLLREEKAARRAAREAAERIAQQNQRTN